MPLNAGNKDGAEGALVALEKTLNDGSTDTCQALEAGLMALTAVWKLRRFPQREIEAIAKFVFKGKASRKGAVERILEHEKHSPNLLETKLFKKLQITLLLLLADFPKIALQTKLPLHLLLKLSKQPSHDVCLAVFYFLLASNSTQPGSKALADKLRRQTQPPLLFLHYKQFLIKDFMFSNHLRYENFEWDLEFLLTEPGPFIAAVQKLRMNDCAMVRCHLSDNQHNFIKQFCYRLLPALRNLMETEKLAVQWRSAFAQACNFAFDFVGTTTEFLKFLLLFALDVMRTGEECLGFFTGMHNYLVGNKLLDSDYSSSDFNTLMAAVIACLLTSDQTLKCVANGAISIFKAKGEVSSSIGSISRFLLMGLSAALAGKPEVKLDLNSIRTLMELWVRSPETERISVNAKRRIHQAYASLTGSPHVSFWKFLEKHESAEEGELLLLAATACETDAERYRYCSLMKPEFRKNLEVATLIRRYGFLDLAEPKNVFELEIPQEMDIATLSRELWSPEISLDTQIDLVMKLFVVCMKAYLVPDALMYLNTAIVICEKWIGAKCVLAQAFRKTRRAVINYSDQRTEPSASNPLDLDPTKYEISKELSGIRPGRTPRGTGNDSVSEEQEDPKFKLSIDLISNELQKQSYIQPPGTIGNGVPQSVNLFLTTFTVMRMSLQTTYPTYEKIPLISKSLITLDELKPSENLVVSFNRCLNLFKEICNCKFEFLNDVSFARKIASVYRWLRVLGGTVFGTEVPLLNLKSAFKFLPGATEGLATYVDRTLYLQEHQEPLCGDRFEPVSGTSCVCVEFDEEDDELWLTLYLKSGHAITSRLPSRNGQTRKDVYKQIQDLVRRSSFPPKEITLNCDNFWKFMHERDTELGEVLRLADQAWIGGFIGLSESQVLMDEVEDGLGEFFMENINRHYKLLTSGNMTTFGLKLLQRALVSGSYTRVKDFVKSVLLHFKLKGAIASDITPESVNLISREVRQFYGIVPEGSRVRLSVPMRPPTERVLDANLNGNRTASFTVNRPHGLKDTPYCVLILDLKAANLPLERFPTFDRRSVSRALSLFQINEWCSRPPPNTTMPIYYILNPERDLPPTHAEFVPDFERRQWTGVRDRAPSHEELTRALKTSYSVVFIGHGWGSRLMPAHNIKQVFPSNSCVFLLGCESLRICNPASLSYPLQAHTARGSPLIVGTLWPVKDKEFNRFTKHLFAKFFDNHQTQAGALWEARRECILPMITGAGVVSYGLPALRYNAGQ